MARARSAGSVVRSAASRSMASEYVSQPAASAATAAPYRRRAPVSRSGLSRAARSSARASAATPPRRRAAAAASSNSAATPSSGRSVAAARCHSPDGFSILSSVACPAVSSCIAAGTTFTASGPRTLAEAWDGTAWTIQPTPNASGTGWLFALACTSAASCTAVGTSFPETGPATLAEYWDGTTWTIQPTPNPSGAPYNWLFGLACPTASSCMAVGTNGDSAGNAVTLGEGWDGTAWTIQQTADPTGAASGQLAGVACLSGSNCVAVGGSNNTPLIE